ncbi:MAG: hypothetical protein Q7P63_04580 [Verrucomicrobiota bacterium JB022]|nr:hypothetical protein [Verrucomicrobiota bacterium JB022]
MEVLLFFWAMLGFIAIPIATSRGQNGCLWFFIAALFGPIAILFAAITPRETPKAVSGQANDKNIPDSPETFDPSRLKVVTQESAESMIATPPGNGERVPCPKCAELILPAAVKCRFCGTDFEKHIGEMFK